MTQPSYQGRTLPRPEDDLEDQGLAFDIGTLFSRRHALQLLGLGAAGSVAACAGASTSGSASSGSASATTSSSRAVSSAPT